MLLQTMESEGIDGEYEGKDRTAQIKIELEQALTDWKPSSAPVLASSGASLHHSDTRYVLHGFDLAKSSRAHDSFRKQILRSNSCRSAFATRLRRTRHLFLSLDIERRTGLAFALSLRLSAQPFRSSPRHDSRYSWRPLLSRTSPPCRPSSPLSSSSPYFLPSCSISRSQPLPYASRSRFRFLSPSIRYGLPSPSTSSRCLGSFSDHGGNWSTQTWNWRSFFWSTSPEVFFSIEANSSFSDRRRCCQRRGFGSSPSSCRFSRSNVELDVNAWSNAVR